MKPALLLYLLVACGAAGSASAATPPSPLLVASGRKLFLKSCAHCHAADASGDDGPDLRDLDLSDRGIAKMITNGKPHEMPSFARKYGPPEIAALIAYLRSLKP